MRTSRLKRIARPAVSTALLATLACGCSGGLRESNADSRDASAGDVQGRSGAGASLGHIQTGELPAGATLPQGRQLVRSTTAVVNGITSDGYVIYTDDYDRNVKAVSVAGGAPKTLGYIDLSDDVFVMGKMVFFSPVLGGLGEGTLSMWWSTRDAAISISSSAASERSLMALASDGETVFFFDFVDANALGTLVVEGHDGVGHTELVRNVELGNGACLPQLQFVGSHLIASYCAAGGGNGPQNATVTSFAGPSWTATPIATNVESWFAADRSGTRVMVAGAAGLVVLPVDGTADGGTTIDAYGHYGTFTSDGESVLYTTTGNVLERSAIDQPSPTPLAANLARVIDVSPDETWVVGLRTHDGQTKGTDLYAASANSNGAALRLLSTTTGTAGGLYGDVFTADSSHAMFFADLAPDVGTLRIAALGANAAPSATLATGAFGAFATGGSRIVFNSDFDRESLTASIKAVDTASPESATTLVGGADAPFYIDDARKLIAYSWSVVAGPAAGVWVMEAP